MERNIQELTEKMLREGVERGQAEAERIVDEAKQKAAAIVENAKREAEEMNDAAQKKLKSDVKNIVARDKYELMMQMNEDDTKVNIYHPFGTQAVCRTDGKRPEVGDCHAGV